MKPAVLTAVCLVFVSVFAARFVSAEDSFLPCPEDAYFDEEFVKNYQLAIESHALFGFDPYVRSTSRTRSNWIRRFSGSAFEWTWTHDFKQRPLTPGQVVLVEKAFFLEREDAYSIAMVLDARTSGGLETFTLDLINSSRLPLAWFEKRLKLSFLCKKIE